MCVGGASKDFIHMPLILCNLRGGDKLILSIPSLLPILWLSFKTKVQFLSMLLVSFETK